MVKAKQLFMRFPWAMAEEENSKQRSWQGHAPPPVFIQQGLMVIRYIQI